MFLGIVFDNHRSNKLEKPTRHLFSFRSDSVRHLLLLYLLTGSTCSFNQAEYASTALHTFQTGNQGFLYIWRVHFLKGIIYFWRITVITWSSSFDIATKRRTLLLKLISFWHPRIRATLLPSEVPVVCFINHSVRLWIHFILITEQKLLNLSWIYISNWRPRSVPSTETLPSFI